MIKTSIVGCGAISRVHAMSIAQMEGVKLLSVADVKKERAEKMAARYGCKAYQSMDALLAGEKPDVVHICTPHSTHTPLAVKALESGVNVLLEKPCGIVEPDIAALETAAGQSGRQLGVCFQNRYRWASQKAKSLLDSKAYGKILGARGIVTWRRDGKYYTDSGWRGHWKTEGGGVMINQAIHTLDLMLWLVGNPLSVEGHIANRHLKGIIEVEDTAEACFDFGNDVRGLFYASTANCFDSPVYLEICCEKGSLVLEGDNFMLRDSDGDVRELIRKSPVHIKDSKSCWGSAHPMLIDDFYDCLRSGRRFPIDAAEGGRALKALLRLYESSETGKSVSF